MRHYLTAFVLTLAIGSLPACGGDTFTTSDSVPTAAPPVIMRISPDSGAARDSITVFGVGYSINPNENILFIGEGASVATSYALVTNGQPGEVEQLTFTVPDESLPGTQETVLLVNDNSSNADVTFTVLP